MSQHWPRWIQASVDKFMKVSVGTVYSVPVYNDFQTQPVPQVSPRLEYAINGPEINDLSAGVTFLDVQIVVLASTVKSDVNWQAMSTLQGIAQAALPGCIPVYKYGSDGIIDTQAQLGILVRQDRIRVLGMGHQDKSNTLRQVGLMANYRMDL